MSDNGQKKKALIIISSNIYIRNYFKTNAFSEIEKAFDVHYAVEESVTLKDEIRNQRNFAGVFGYDQRGRIKRRVINDYLLVAERKKSSSFILRYRNGYHKSLSYLKPRVIRLSPSYHQMINRIPSFARKYLSFLIILIVIAKRLPKACRGGCDNLIYTMIACTGITPLIKKLYLQFMSPNKMLEKITLKLRPDLVIVPSQAMDVVGNDVQLLRHKYDFFKTLYLIDNWDNMTTKSTYIKNPDFIGVWGEQSAKHAMEIHGFKPEQIFYLGTPRFEIYYQALADYVESHKKPKSPYPFPYILFAGTSQGFDELTALSAVDQVVSEVAHDSLKDLKIIYRAHPWRLQRFCKDIFDPNEYLRVILDKQIEEHYYRPDTQASKQPDLSYYPKIIMNAELVVCPLSTMLIEAAILLKHVIVPAWDDGYHYNAPKNFYKYARHFEGIDQIVGLKLVHDIKDFKKLFLEMFHHRIERIPFDTHMARIKYFIYRDEMGYPRRLKNAADKILGVMSSERERPNSAQILGLQDQSMVL